MQVRIFQEEIPHYHKLEPATAQQGNKFWFRDDGVLFYGLNEFDAVEIRSSFGLNPRIIFEDLQDAFRLGLAVGQLRLINKSECEI